MTQAMGVRSDMRRTKRRSDNLATAREAGRWLSTLTRDCEAACEQVAAGLSDAEQFGPFSAERHRAVLLVDKWAAPFQEELLAEYPFAGSERAQKLASILRRISANFGRYYDELIDALRAVPRDSAYPHLSYVALTRRLAQARYECILHALDGDCGPPNWHKVHRMYRIAAQELARDDSRGDDANRGAALGTTAEAEYIQILLGSRLAGAGLDASELLRALAWLGRWAGTLKISFKPRSANAFAIYPTGSDGLSMPPDALSVGLLWLDVAPLHLEIRREKTRALEEPAVDDADDEDDYGLSRDRRIALLERLLQIWSGPRGNDARREPRRRVQKPVQAAFGLRGIVDAIRLSETIGKQLRKADAADADTAAASVQSTKSRLARWTVDDVSDSGCRMRGETHAVSALPIGTPVAIRVDVNETWVIGLIRRRGELTGPESFLGIELIATRLKLLALHDRPRSQAMMSSGDASANATPGEPGPARPAILLGPGPRAPIRQSILVDADDYDPGRIWYCDTRHHRYKLTLEQVREKSGGCVWAAVAVEKIARLVPRDHAKAVGRRGDTLFSSGASLGNAPAPA